jgi:hypothetical protein
VRVWMCEYRRAFADQIVLVLVVVLVLDGLAQRFRTTDHIIFGTFWVLKYPKPCLEKSIMRNDLEPF